MWDCSVFKDSELDETKKEVAVMKVKVKLSL
jgi:hypothetical protein